MRATLIILTPEVRRYIAPSEEEGNIFVQRGRWGYTELTQIYKINLFFIELHSENILLNITVYNYGLPCRSIYGYMNPCQVISTKTQKVISTEFAWSIKLFVLGCQKVCL